MFVTQKRHIEQLNHLERLYESRIGDLRSQIEDLRRLVFTPAPALALPYQALEADAVLSGSERPVVEMSREDDEKLDFLAQEAARIMSGDYDTIEATS